MDNHYQELDFHVGLSCHNLDYEDSFPDHNQDRYHMHLLHLDHEFHNLGMYSSLNEDSLARYDEAQDSTWAYLARYDEDHLPTVMVASVSW